MIAATFTPKHREVTARGTVALRRVTAALHKCTSALLQHCTAAQLQNFTTAALQHSCHSALAPGMWLGGNTWGRPEELQRTPCRLQARASIWRGCRTAGCPCRVIYASLQAPASGLWNRTPEPAAASRGSAAALQTSCKVNCFGILIF